MTGPLMARPDDLARVLRSRLEAVADPVRAAGEAKYLKLERRRVIGASMPGAERVLTGVVQEFGLPADLDMLDALFGASLEEAWCAIWMLAAQPAFNAETWRLTEAWSGAPDTWALADPISLLLVAGHLEAGVIAEDVLRAWAARESPFWFRRIALVATVSLNDGLHGPTRRRLRRIGRVPPIGEAPRPQLTLDLLEASIHDRRHFIRLGHRLGAATVVRGRPRRRGGVRPAPSRPVHEGDAEQSAPGRRRAACNVISLMLDTDIGDVVTTAAPTPARRSYPPTSCPRAG